MVGGGEETSKDGEKGWPGNWEGNQRSMCLYTGDKDWARGEWPVDTGFDKMLMVENILGE